jgi:hypothetical protein
MSHHITPAPWLPTAIVPLFTAVLQLEALRQDVQQLWSRLNYDDLQRVHRWVDDVIDEHPGRGRQVWDALAAIDGTDFRVAALGSLHARDLDCLLAYVLRNSYPPAAWTPADWRARGASDMAAAVESNIRRGLVH